MMSKVLRQKKCQLFCFLITILGVNFGANSFLSQAQGPLQWSPQAKVPFYEERTEEPPFLIADQNRTIHAFNSQPFELEVEGSPRVVVYRRWALEGGWTDPIDVIFDPRGVEVLAVFFDQISTIHLVLAIEGDIYHTRAPLVNAGRAPAWASINFVGKQAQNPFSADITGDQAGNLVTIYSGLQDGKGIYAAQSADDGDTWSEPVPIYLTYDVDLVATAPKLYMGQRGQLHAVWSTFQKDGSGGPGYYARLNRENGQWSDLVELDPFTPAIRTPNVIEYDNQVIVSYYNHNVNGNWWRRSQDGGITWSDPVRISPLHVGTNGIVSFVVDSSQALHGFFGERIDDNNHGMWHIVWTGSGWTEPNPVVRGPNVKDEIGGVGFDPRSARAVISNGNLLLVTWGTDGFAGVNGAWYAYGILDTPALPTVSLPLPTVPPKESPLSTVTPTSAAVTPSPTKPVSANPQSSDSPVTSFTNNPTMPLVVGLVPVVALIVIIITAHQIFQRIRH